MANGKAPRSPSCTRPNSCATATAEATPPSICPTSPRPCRCSSCCPSARASPRSARRLDAGRLAAIVHGLSAKPVLLSLPRFHLATHTLLNGTLEALGMTRRVQRRRRGLLAHHQVAEPLKIGVVDHAADFTVDEQGTVAAAATIVTIEAAAAPVRSRGRSRSTPTARSCSSCATIAPAPCCSPAATRPTRQPNAADARPRSGDHLLVALARRDA